jgi:LPXTG-site transpeptidase (sortase) family protein
VLAVVAFAACGSGDEQRERPYALRIDSIGVDTAVVTIESDDGVLEPPDDAELAGWWRQGAGVGQSSGSTVIVGHSASAGGGVFDAVDNLMPGDVVEVDSTTRTLTYEVGSIDVLSKDDFAARADQIFSQDGDGRLVLITCADWDGSAWLSNVVAITTPKDA